MDLSAKLYHDFTIKTKKNYDLKDYGHALANHFPKYKTQSTQMESNKLRLDMIKDDNFKGKLLALKKAITVEMSRQGEGVLLQFSNGDFMLKLIMLIISPIFFALAGVLFFLGISSFITIPVYRAMDKSIVGIIIKIFIFFVLSIAATVVVICNIVGFVKQLKLANDISGKFKCIVENDTVLSDAQEYVAKFGGDMSDTAQTAEYADVAQQTVSEAVRQVSPTVVNYLKRVWIFLEDEVYDKADDYCEKVLDEDPENADAYLGKLMAELHISNKNRLPELAQSDDLLRNKNYQRFLRYATDEQKMVIVSVGQCKFCKKSIDSDMSFCPFCGEKIEW